MKALKNVLVIGEEDVFKELSEIISIAQKTNIIVKDSLKLNYEQQKLSKYMEQVQALEKKSDEIAFKIGENVTSGAISPNIIDDLLESIATADNIVDIHFNIIREMNRMAKSHLIDIEIHQKILWEKVYESLLGLAEESLKKLEKMLTASEELEISRLRKKVETIEEQGDEVKDQGFDKLYSITPKISYLQFYHYSEILHKCDDILDSCQDLSQLIVSIVTSILK